MKERLKKLLSKDFLKSFLVLSGGSLLAQIISFICSMIMTRQYSKVDIGYYTYILSIVTMFTAVINFRYDVSVVLAKTEKEALGLIKLSFYILILFSFIITICVYTFNLFYSSPLEQHKELIFFVLPLLILYGTINILNAYNNRHSEYKLISRGYFIRVLIQNLLTILFGVFSSSAILILLSQVSGLIFGMRKQSQAIIVKLKEIINMKTSYVISVAKKYKNQPILSVPSSFVNAISYSLIGIFIGNNYDISILAMYSISVMVLGVPLGIFSSNIAKVHFKDSTDELKNTGFYKVTTKKMIIFSSILSCFIVIFLILFAPSIFEIIYGKSWVESGVYVSILSPMFGLRLVAGAIGFSFVINNKQNLELLFQIGLVVVMCLVSYLAYQFTFPINNYLCMISVGYGMVYVLEIWQMYNCSKKGVIK